MQNEQISHLVDVIKSHEIRSLGLHKSASQEVIQSLFNMIGEPNPLTGLI